VLFLNFRIVTVCVCVCVCVFEIKCFHVLCLYKLHLLSSVGLKCVLLPHWNCVFFATRYLLCDLFRLFLCGHLWPFVLGTVHICCFCVNLDAHLFVCSQFEFRYTLLACLWAYAEVLTIRSVSMPTELWVLNYYIWLTALYHCGLSATNWEPDLSQAAMWFVRYVVFIITRKYYKEQRC